jgi:hypothetical protein
MEIIKNPFDIVQLILQLFAPLTELMELAKFLSLSLHRAIIFLLRHRKQKGKSSSSSRRNCRIGSDYRWREKNALRVPWVVVK